MPNAIAVRWPGNTFWTVETAAEVEQRLILKEQSGLHFLQFASLTRIPGLFQAVFLRSGGVSRGAFKGLNISRRMGDDDEGVTTNRRRILQVAGNGRLVLCRQVHGRSVLFVEGGASGASCDSVTGVGTADAMITEASGTFLTIQVADCQPVFVVDSRRRVVANIHSGWRGSMANIIGATVDLMASRFGCQPGELWAGVGPSLGPCCAEFINFKQEIPRQYWGYRDDRRHFDFWNLSRDQLAAAGLQRDRIALSHICTRCNPHLFFSYRAARVTGRFAAVIGWKG
jgi:YfiH family protein